MTIREQFEQLRQDKNKVVFLLLVCAGLAYADFNFVIGSQVKGARAATKKKASMNAEIRRLETELQVLRQQAAASNAVPSQDISLVSEGEMPFLLKFVSEAARSCEVKVMQISSRKEEPRDRALESKGVVPVSVKMEMVGAYHNVMALINKLENAQYAFFIEELKMAPDQLDAFKQRVTMSAKTYVKR